MRFFEDDPRTTRVRWYFVPRGTPFVPYPNRWVSSTWDADPKPLEDMGEQFTSGVWQDGERPPGIPLPPVHLCGTEEQWRFGQAMPPLVPVPLDANGVPLCCTQERRVVFPFENDIWFVADDVPGPQWASVGHWSDRADVDNPADQVEAEDWGSIDRLTPGLPRAVRFQGGEHMDMEKPLLAPSWTIWSAFFPEAGKFVNLLEAASGNAFISTGATNNGVRTVRLGVNSGALVLVVGVSGLVWRGPVFVRAAYDGATLSLKVYNQDLVGEQSAEVSPLDTPDWSRIGNTLGGPIHESIWVSEIMGWTRVLSAAEDAAILDYLTGRYPSEEEEMVTGGIVPFAGPLVPTGYLACDGTDYAEEDYPELVGAIGHVWDTFRGASSPGAGRFRLPWLDGLTLVGSGINGSNPSTTGRDLADTGGEEAHLLTAGEMPSHSHDVDDPTHIHGIQDGAGAFISPPGTTVRNATTGTLSADPIGFTDASTTGITLDNAGGDGSHNNMPPFAGVMYIIKT